MAVKELIIKFARDKKRFQYKDLRAFLDSQKRLVSRAYINRVLLELVKGEVLDKSGTYNIWYSLKYFEIEKSYLNKNISENEILQKDVMDNEHFPQNLKDNTKSIFEYSFTEMLNNAIEHSKSKKVTIKVSLNEDTLAFDIIDAGIGVFRNIKNKKKLTSELDAIQDLMKGKTTTAKHHHSGEGIFFTSKIADKFILESYDLRLTIDNVINDIFIEELEPEVKGTVVKFILDIDTNKHIIDLFEEYTTDLDVPVFDKTKTHIKLYNYSDIYISRSQARRLLSGLEKFSKIVLDFKDVPTVGQAFADEVFRVFLLKYPEKIIEPINMNKVVKFMVDRAINTKLL